MKELDAFLSQTFAARRKKLLKDIVLFLHSFRMYAYIVNDVSFIDELDNIIKQVESIYDRKYVKRNLL